MIVFSVFSGLTEMRAVKEQRDKLLRLSSDFAQRLKHHLFEIFTRHVSWSVLPQKLELLISSFQTTQFMVVSFGIRNKDMVQ